MPKLPERPASSRTPGDSGNPGTPGSAGSPGLHGLHRSAASVKPEEPNQPTQQSESSGHREGQLEGAPGLGSALHLAGAPEKPGVPEPSHNSHFALPHERDQTVGQIATEPDPIIAQAKRDLDAGMVDTDMRATPGLDAERRADLLSAPAAALARAPHRVGGLSR